ncbi:MAG TPA: hypothetical protein VGH38_28485 [Bryobacteraceae bacterium]|jgi:hypothetical protein
MDWLEQELKQALERKDPPPGFAERVTAAAARGTDPAPRPVAMAPRRPAVPRWLPVAAAVLVIAGGSAAYREHQGRVAKERVMLAMRITAGKLNRIQTHVRGARP